MAVTFALGNGTGRGILTNVTDNHDGTYTANFTGTIPGSVTITGTLNGQPITSALPTVTVGADPAKSTISVVPASVPAGGAARITLTSRDAAGNQLASGGEHVSFGLGGNSGSGTFSDVTDNNDGTYTATFTGNLAGPATVNADIDWRALTSLLPTITVTPGPLSLARSTISVSSDYIAVGSSVQVTLTAKDAAGNQETSGGLPFSFGLGAGQGSGTFSNLTDNKDGTYSASFTPTTPGAVLITATLNNQPLTSAPPSLVATSATAAVSIPGGGTLVAGQPFQINVQAVDQAGKPVSARGSVIIASGPPDPQATLPNTGMLDISGFGTLTAVFKTAGSYSLSISAGSLPTVTRTVTVVPAPVSSLSITSPSGATTGSPFDITVAARDAFGNLTDTYNGVVHFSSTDAYVSLPRTRC